MPLHFLVDLDELHHAATGATVTLTGAEAHHAATVRRVRIGEEVTIGDGHGVWATGECEFVSAREVTVRITARRDVPMPSPRIVLAQALAKGDRDELAIQAATELGVDEIVPWEAARSVSRWSGGGPERSKAEKGRARWASIVREAAKQAHRAWTPTVGVLAHTAELCERAANARVFVLEPRAHDRLTELSFDPGDSRDIVLVVGPEGGIADEELAALQSAGAVLVRLGDTVLRTSTAGPAALAVVSSASGRW